MTNLEQQIEYLAERFNVVDLEDSNLVEIIKHRMLAPKPGMESVRDDAFKLVESSGDEVRQILLDAQGRTEASLATSGSSTRSPQRSSTSSSTSRAPSSVSAPASNSSRNCCAAAAMT
ncbi:hypothetical protein ACH3WN_06685 [Streptomyces albogriseolus]|uniref:hypothetical protein n=1 Tax=Streptomyces albogriseolus TaxID=1887 RepID=UPI00378E07D5